MNKTVILSNGKEFILREKEGGLLITKKVDSKAPEEEDQSISINSISKTQIKIK